MANSYSPSKSGCKVTPWFLYILFHSPASVEKQIVIQNNTSEKKIIMLWIFSIGLFSCFRLTRSMYKLKFLLDKKLFSQSLPTCHLFTTLQQPSLLICDYLPLQINIARRVPLETPMANLYHSKITYLKLW